MVKYSEQTLDRTFAALADPTRRALLARLQGRDTLSVSELAQPFAMSLPAIMKHLDVLSDAGLIAREKTGRMVACRLTAKPMEQAMDWLNRYQRFWSDNPRPPCRFCGGRTMASQSSAARRRSRRDDQASPSSAGSTRRPEKVYAAWTDPQNLIQWFGRVEAKPGIGAGRGRSTGRRPLPHQLRHRRAANIIEVGGVYREVVPNQRLVFSWAWHSTPERESLVTVHAEARWRRHAADAAPRAIVR